jgi:hypothetical protein
MTLGLSKGLNSADISLTSLEDENIQFPKCCFLLFRNPDNIQIPETH